MLKEKLIEEVRKYPLLYDLRDPKYSDVHKKEKAWNEIAIVLSQPVTSVDNTDDGDDENSLSAAEILANVTNNEESQDSSIISERPESSVSMYDSSRSVFPDIPKTTKRKKLQETSASAVLMEYLLKKNDEDGKQNDEMDKFFLSISSTVKKLSTYNQALLKSRIFNLVSEAEIQELQNNRNCYYDDFFCTRNFWLHNSKPKCRYYR
ncbi:unnamed protein product [Parnassius apollo]|uniref:(apollo) hypothetical protein n=1 Tax=Parnassius apollo TaxID=110799 RepID=A0A8S3WE98_PARAO|nr:unnamed protein product [Parnassius apollo]